MLVHQVDRRAEPVRRMVALGESTTLGASASSIEKCWVSQVAALLEEFQGSKIEVINQGIGSNVLTPECPSYEYSVKPSALERLDDELLDLQPDLILLSYGLNDSRGGTPVHVFRRAYQELIDRIRARSQALIVLLNTFYVHEVVFHHCVHWEESDYPVAELFNLVIQQLAEANDLILADVYSAEAGVDWVIDPDHVHPNDLGHRLIANRVFEAIVRNCSFPARTFPAWTLQTEFVRRYGYGPDRPSARSLALAQAGARPPFPNGVPSGRADRP